MPRLLAVLFFLFLFADSLSQDSEKRVVHTLFLLGDGGEPHVKETTLGKVLRAQLKAAEGNSTVLFLGDNIYDSGLPDVTAADYDEAESALNVQVELVRGMNTRGIFIPGNHDWQHWGKKGLEYIRNQQQWIDSLKDENITLLPRDGCPGPVQIPIGDKTLLVILDTQWLLHQWEKTEDPEICHAVTTAEVLAQVEDIFRTNPGKRIILAGHHPLITYGEHGGVFTWKAHIFPLQDVSKYLYIPMPVIGSIYPLYRKWFGHLQDTPHPLYKQFSLALQNIMRAYPGAVYAAGHDHALQYIVKDSTHYIVSGAAAKTEYVKKKGYAVFAKDVIGFARVSILDDGSLRLHFIQVDEDHPDGTEIFSQEIPQITTVSLPAIPVPDLKNKTLVVKASDQYEAGKVKQWLLGKNYRSAWAQEIEVPMFDIGMEKGGLSVLQKGGGQQTLSLRMADSAGREYVLRTVEKFPEAAIPEMLRKTFAQDLVQDQISASHPYAALVVAPMAEAIGLYHTNPRLVFIPEDPRFGEHRETFANTLALFEERPDGDWSDAPYFGNSKKIISTRKVIEKLAEDNDNRVDEKLVLRNRLFDLIIGDWDRHDDQWRFATVKDKKDDVYQPIPRDRDQTFFVNQGALAKLWSRKWALPKFEGFDEDIDWPAGLSYNARHFDRSFLTALSREDWVNAANQIRADLTDEIIESSIRHWPEEIFKLHGEEIIRHLKTRRDNIVTEALSYYAFLAREVEVTGSDKTEVFNAVRLSNGDVHLQVLKITKDGERGKKLYDRIFRNGETNEIRLYGFKGDDVFEVSGASNKSIQVRIIGGEGKDLLVDSSRVRGLSRKTFFYDQIGEGAFRSNGEVRDMRMADKSVNEYNRTAFEFDRLAPLVFGNYNPDDGLFIGAGFLFTKNGFRKDPFSQRHLFLASIAPMTQSYNFRYQVKFTHAIGRWNLELDADIKAPNYVNNFFGMGNESIYNDDIDDEPGIEVDEEIHYYRYRFQEIFFQPSVSRSLGMWGSVKLGPMFQRVKVEIPDAGQDRFVETWAAEFFPDLFEEHRMFGGLGWQYERVQRDDELFTHRGSAVSLSGRNLAQLNKGDNNFSSYEGSLAIFHSFREKSGLVFAARVGGGINRGIFPFYQSQVLGGKTELRGYRKTRFYGDSRVYANFEVRARLLTFRSYLFPASMGILGFHDLGRIWYKNEHSDRWHRGWGGGLWFTPFNFTVVSAEVGHSREGTLGYLRLGFMF